MSEVRNAADAVNALAERFWNGLLELSPITATVLGYDDYDDRLDDPGPEGRDKARRLFRETLHATDEIEAQAAAAGPVPGSDGGARIQAFGEERTG